jgi:hypothetical protein
MYVHPGEEFNGLVIGKFATGDPAKGPPPARLAPAMRDNGAKKKTRLHCIS